MLNFFKPRERKPVIYATWLEKNQTKAVIGYTIFIAGVVWAVIRFVLVDSRLELLKNERDLYKAKVELLSNETATLRSENSEYISWLSKTKNAIPVIVPEITKLKRDMLH